MFYFYFFLKRQAYKIVGNIEHKIRLRYVLRGNLPSPHIRRIFTYGKGGVPPHGFEAFVHVNQAVS